MLVSAPERRGVGLGVMAAIEAPNEQPHARRGGVAKGHWRAAVLA
jgi:hypothetical protein